jgi:hypothetical protein
MFRVVANTFLVIVSLLCWCAFVILTMRRVFREGYGSPVLNALSLPELWRQISRFQEALLLIPMFIAGVLLLLLNHG